jgi:hypothetical protein
MADKVPDFFVIKVVETHGLPNFIIHGNDLHCRAGQGHVYHITRLIQFLDYVDEAFFGKVQ